MIRRAAVLLGTILPILAVPMLADAALGAPPAACPTTAVRVVRSAGGVIDYRGSSPGIPDLCRIDRADGNGYFYYGVWRDDWPGAGQAYPALKAVVTGPVGTQSRFVTRSAPGLQWVDTFINEGVSPMVVDGRRYTVLQIAHEREGIEGNTYHSIITTWRDVATGMALRTVERQIAGQSYGPQTTWQAVSVAPLR